MNAQRGSSTPTRPRGFALPAAIFGLVVVGVLVTGGFYIARQETRIGMANRQATQSFYLAERGMNEVIERWNAGTFVAQADWTQTTFSDTVAEGTWDVEVTKMSDWTYMLDATSTITRGGELLSGATRRMGMAAKFTTAAIDPPAALTTRGQVAVRGGALVDGHDTNPAGWSQCPPAVNDKTGVLTDLDSDVSTDGGGATAGEPPEAKSADITDETFTQFGDLSWEDLTAMANHRFAGGSFSQIAPVVTGDGLCDISVTTNWGDPRDPFSACGGWFPIVYVNGNASIQGNGNQAALGQGMLLVEGDLSIQGGFEYIGIIIVQGSFDARGNKDPRILGAVMASNAILDPESLAGNALVQYSSCGVTQALLNNPNLTRLRPLAQRSWVDLTNLSN